MPAIPVAPNRHPLPAGVLGAQTLFERGDRLYIQTPVQIFRPSADQVEEYAFSRAVKSNAPNENIVWLKGQYVEADKPNANGAEWRAQELAIKSLTPMLMPVTVMHDPRTAVGTIADVALRTPEKDGVPRTRIDTVLALWGHRFPDAVHEAETNASQGTLMQSMECYSPWYECSDCGAVFHKLPGGAERASWCEHLAKAGHPDDSMKASATQSSNASRILGDVCFTGTGLIFGTRGAKGAYSEAYLEEFQDEVAQYHHTAHAETATNFTTSPRSTPTMGLVQIEQSELDTLRKERDDARTEATAAKAASADVERKVTELETEKVAAEERASTAEQKVTTLEEQANRATLKGDRMKALGTGFVAKLGDFTKERLETKAESLSDADWDAELKAVEEIAKVKRDAVAEGGGEGGDGGEGDKGKGGDEQAQSGTFSLEEIAKAGGFTGSPASGGATLPSDIERSSVIGSLAGAFKK
jgi:hypothetical protein